MPSSDSDDASEKGAILKQRLQMFKAKRPKKLVEQKLVCQILLEQDYVDYIGLEDAFHARGWEVIRTGLQMCRTEQEEDFLIPNVQWCSYTKAAWEAVMTGQLITNHYFMRSGIIRKADLAQLIQEKYQDTMPESYVWSLASQRHLDEFIRLVHKLVQDDGIWILKPGDSSNANEMHVFNRSCVGKIEKVLMSSSRNSWKVQKYIERPLLINGFKFHLRAWVLAVGNLKVYLHEKVIALMASKPYAVNDLDDLCIHASNHSVQERAGVQGPCSHLLHDLEKHVDSTPDIRESSAEIGSAMEVKIGGVWSTKIWHQMSKMVWKIFNSASDPNLLSRVFKPLPCSFELFGLDAMVDEDGKVWLLEINCDPDLKVFDTRWQDVAREILHDTIDTAVYPIMGKSQERVTGYHLIFDIDDKNKHADNSHELQSFAD
mmetsp:Transcript_1004/g.3155  ORF Transcript_1004/g.3155 Transcript_1004/m.3155 type:complete len:431 (-) Transcript_1004:746-2038(-)